MALPRFTDKTNVRIGFEVECYIRDSKCKEWEKIVKQLHSENIISSDFSINPDSFDDGGDDVEYGRAYEIQSAVLPPASAMANLKQLFACVVRLGDTNDSCGLHLNISTINKKRMKQFNPFPFIASALWDKMVRDFGRQNNDYCMTPNVNTGITPMDLFSSVGYGDGYSDGLGCSCFDKESCVNFANFGNGQSKSSRVEIRGMGGEAYHEKFPLVADYTIKVIRLFTLCCDIPIVDFKKYSV